MGQFRCEIQGTTPLPGEVWSVGLNFIGPRVLVPFTDLRDWATAVGVALNALPSTGLIGAMSTDGKITTIRTEERDSDDDSLVQAAEYTLPSPKTGSGTISKTLQTTACISLLTGRPGRSYRGRVYWPTWAYSGTATGMYGGTDMTNFLASFKTIVDAIVTAGDTVTPDLELDLVVRSRLLHQSTQVNLYGLGNVPDTQRRRRDAAIETYQTLAP